MRIKIRLVVNALLFLAFLGVLGLENYFILLALLVIILVGISKTDIDIKNISLFLILLLHVIIYMCNYSRISLDWLAKNFLNPIILFLCGYWLMNHSKQTNKPVELLVYGFFIHGALNICIYILDPTSMVQRSMVNIWGGYITATLQNLLFIPIIGFLYYALFLVKEYKTKIVIILGCLIAIYGTIISASRTLILLLIICFCAGILVDKRSSNLERTKRIIAIISLTIVFIILYNANFFEIKTWFETSGLGERLASGVQENDSFLKNVRWQMSLKILNNLATHPFGNITVVNYAHNLYLDMAKYTGIIPAPALFIWSISLLIDYYKHIRYNPLCGLDIALLCILIGFEISFFLEPILDGLPIIFGAFCYLGGIIRGRTKQLKKGALISEEGKRI